MPIARRGLLAGIALLPRPDTSTAGQRWESQPGPPGTPQALAATSTGLLALITGPGPNPNSLWVLG
ncbi:MAG: hypothetical protein WAS07_10325 [Micropruina sp.]